VAAMFALQPDVFQLSIEANATVTRSYAIEGQTFGFARRR
jgi:hypothetical protein